MLAERLIEWTEGFERKGLMQGREEGYGALVARQLTRRFGPLPAEVQTRVMQATSVQLEGWSDRLLDAATLEDVFSGEQLC